jgi:iron only hydrogenase large subunit-like protein
MACPEGCTNGGGQLKRYNIDNIFDDNKEVMRILEDTTKKSVIDFDGKEYEQYFQESSYPKGFLTKFWHLKDFGKF